MDESEINQFLPLVSIIIPVYNGANYMKEAIDSALAQTYTNIEVLVINDGSKDSGATDTIALSYGDKIRYFHKENGGVATALNLGIQEMKGEYFSWLSHDDVYYPEKVQIQIDFLRKYPQKDIVLYTNCTYINDKSEVTGHFITEHLPPEKFRARFALGNFINGCTLLIPKKCFDTCGNFRLDLKTTQDYDLFFRISEKFQFIHLTDEIVKSRIHPEQDTVKLWNTQVKKEANNLYYQFLEQLSIADIEELFPNEIASYYLAFAENMKKRQSLVPFDYALKLSLRYLPWHTPTKLKELIGRFLDLKFPVLMNRWNKLKYIIAGKA
jgi:glycosyltransferase involved in cell wall biosynthesis